MNASDLIKQQKERESKKSVTYEKIYTFVEKKVRTASLVDNYYTWYLIPEFLVGLPLYSINDCKKYIENKLKKNGFETEFYEPNLLLIKWG
jgi:hypothetical protein